MDWRETESLLEKLHTDLTKSWEHLRAVAKQETFTNSISTEKKMKSAKFLSEAAERLQVLQVVHRRVMNRFSRLYIFMGLNPRQAEEQKVGVVTCMCSGYQPKKIYMYSTTCCRLLYMHVVDHGTCML